MDFFKQLISILVLIGLLLIGLVSVAMGEITTETTLDLAQYGTDGGGYTPSTGGEYVTLNFDRANLEDVTRFLGKILDVNFVLAPDVKGTVSIQSATQFSKGEVFSVLEAVLTVNKCKAVQAGENLYQIVKMTQQVNVPSNEEVFVYYLQNGDAKTIATTLKASYGNSLNVLADASMNGIIIRTYPWYYPKLEEVIRKMDLRREDSIPKQVLIDVMIAELKLDDDIDYGVEWAIKGHAYNTISGTDYAYDTNTQMNNRNLFSDIAGLSGFSFSITEESLMSAIIHAYASLGKFKILSSPHILTSAGKEAEIKIGEEVPIITRTQATPSGTGGITITNEIEYRDTGILLTVTPHIYGKNLVLLDIEQEVTEVTISSIAGETMPSLRKKYAKTTVAVKDKNTLVIAGLIEEKEHITRSGIPILSKIPFLGQLFAYNSRKFDKTELIIQITPRIVGDVEEATKISDDLRSKMHWLRNELDIEPVRLTPDE